MEYHDVLPNISLSRMSVYAYKLFGQEEEHILRKNTKTPITQI